MPLRGIALEFLSTPLSLNTTWTFNSLDDEKAVNDTTFPAPDGYRFENAYFYVGCERKTVTAFKLYNGETLGNYKNLFSDIIFRISGDTRWYSYNPFFDVLYIACTKVVNYTASFDLNYDGLYGSSNPYTTGQTVPSGSTITKPADPPTHDGFQFAGWEFYDATQDDYRAWDFSSDVVTGNVTLYATWTPDDPIYKVFYHWVDSTGYATPEDSLLPADVIDITEDSYGLESVPGPIIGYTVPTGWYTTNEVPALGSTSYSGEVDLTTLADNNHEVNLYAYCEQLSSVNLAWTSDTEETCKSVPTMPAGVTIPGSIDDIESLSAYDFDSKLPTLTAAQQADGYSIFGWFSDEEGTTPLAPANLTSGDTIYVRCTYTEPSTYYVHYTWADGSSKPDGVTLPGNQDSITLTALHAITVSTLGNSDTVTAGYTFAGWFTDVDHTNPFNAADLSAVHSSITLYAYFTYLEPTRAYSVTYHFNYKANGASDWISKGVYKAVDNGSITEAAATSLGIYNAAGGANATYTLDSKVYHIGVFSTDGETPTVSSTGSWGAGNLAYTVQFYLSEYTRGSLTIAKSFAGDSVTAPTDLSFKVTGPDDYDHTFFYKDFTGTTSTGGSFTIPGLTPGTYTVTEDKADINGYTRTTASGTDEDTNTDGYQVTVAAQEAPAQMTITNTYTSKTYEVIFDAGEHGKVSYGGTPITDATETVKWSEYNTGADSFYDWSGGLSTATGVSKIVYHFTYGEYLQYQDQATPHTFSFGKPTVHANDGYEITDSFDDFTSFDFTMADLVRGTGTTTTDKEGVAVTSITYTATCAASHDTNYYVLCEYQDANGAYTDAVGTYTQEIRRNGTTGTTAAILDGDSCLTPAKNMGITGKIGLTYVLDTDKTTADELSKTIAGDGTTTLHVFFKWQQGVTYQYNGATAAILATYPLPTDSAKYDCGAATTNTGAANGTQYTSAAGNTWELRWNQQSAPMTDSGVTYTGTWTYAAKGQASVTVQYVDKQGNLLRESDMKTDDYEAPYDFASAQNVTYISSNGYYYTFSADYAGQFSANHADEDVSSYAGTIPTSNLTITRVYNTVTTPVQVVKNYTGIQMLPSNFNITVSDGKYMGDNGSVTLALSDGTVDTANRTVTWTVEVPVGVECIYTENNCSNGAYWSYVLTAQQSNGRVSNEGYNYQTLKVSNNNSVRATVNQLNEMPKVMFNRLSEGYHYDNQIILTNAYTYTYVNTPDYGGGVGGGGDDNDDTPTPVVIPNNPTPLSPTPGTTTEIPDGDVPQTEIPDGETPLAATPAKTGDNLVLWVLAAGVSGIGLIWVSLLGKKRRDEDGSQN